MAPIIQKDMFEPNAEGSRSGVCCNDNPFAIAFETRYFITPPNPNAGRLNQHYRLSADAEYLFRDAYRMRDILTQHGTSLYRSIFERRHQMFYLCLLYVEGEEGARQIIRFRKDCVLDAISMLINPVTFAKNPLPILFEVQTILDTIIDNEIPICKNRRTRDRLVDFVCRTGDVADCVTRVNMLLYLATMSTLQLAVLSDYQAYTLCSFMQVDSIFTAT